MAPSRKFASFIFRTRGIYLLLALALSMFLKYRAQGTTSLSLFLAGVTIALGTQVFRTYAAGYLWGRQAVAEVGADFLCTSGPYAHTRNPLYLGNLLIGMAASLAINEWHAFVLFAAAWLFVYSIVIPYEEEFLRQKFATQYEEYAAHTGRLFPRFPAYRGGGGTIPNYRAGVLGELHVPVFLAILFAVVFLLFVPGSAPPA